MKKTLQEQYNLIKKGKGNKLTFIKESKMMFPNIIPQNMVMFSDVTNSLKRNHIIYEPSKNEKEIDFIKVFKENMEVKANSTKPRNEIVDKEIQGYNFKDKEHIENVFSNQFLKGFTAEMNDPKNKDKDVDEIKEIVKKNLTTDFNYYVKKGMFGIKDMGYETMPEPKEPKGPHKSSGYGSLNEGIMSTIRLKELALQIQESTNSIPSSGLAVFIDTDIEEDEGSTIEQIKVWLEESDYYAEYDEDQKIFFFPEVPEEFSNLENQLREEFDALNINVEFAPINNEEVLKENFDSLQYLDYTNRFPIQLSDEEIDMLYTKYPELDDPYFGGSQYLPDFPIPEGFDSESQTFLVRVGGNNYLVFSSPHSGDVWLTQQNHPINENISNQYNNLSDKEIIDWAEEDGLLDVVETDEYGNLINREEVLNAILGTETPNTDIEGDFIDQKGDKLDMLFEDHLDSNLPQPAIDIINFIMEEDGKGSQPYKDVEKIIFEGWDGGKFSWEAFQKLTKYITELYESVDEIMDEEMLNAFEDLIAYTA